MNDVAAKTPAPAQLSKREKFVRWTKKLGVWGIVFFTLKGLAWLLIPYLIGRSVLN